jgi:hypothetical protein
MTDAAEKGVVHPSGMVEGQVLNKLLRTNEYGLVLNT